MIDFAGKLDISLRRDGGGLGVSIRSSRPVTAARVFAGQPIAAVARRLPTLFSICAIAQAQACTSACERAAALTASRGALQRRALLLQAETAKEHLWRLLLDWPAALAAEPGHPAMAQAMRAFLALRGALGNGVGTGSDPFALSADLPLIEAGSPARRQLGAHGQVMADVAREQVFGMPPERWLMQVQDADALAAWAASSGTPAAELLNRLLHEDLAGFGRSGIEPLPAIALSDLPTDLSGVDADAFAAAPTWRGLPHETTPFARCRDRSLVAALAAEYGNGLLPRLAALLVELADALVELVSEPLSDPESAAQLPPAAGAAVGIGIAAAARGLLMHRVELADGVVASYRILAPTEWNFHPSGVVAAGLAAGDLARLLDDAELKRRAALYITAVDPCVAYDLVVEKGRVPSA